MPWPPKVNSEPLKVFVKFVKFVANRTAATNFTALNTAASVPFIACSSSVFG